MLVFFLSSSWRPKYSKVKNGLVRHINCLTPELEDLTQPIFHLCFCRGSHVKKLGAQGSKLCGTVSSSSWNFLHFWVVKIESFLIKYWFEQLIEPDMIICSIPLFQFPEKKLIFSRLSLARSDLVHVSKEPRLYYFSSANCVIEIN